MSRILILTQTGDVHAKVVKDALAHKGHEAILWYGADMPTMQAAALAIDPEGGVDIQVSGPDLEGWGDFDVVWLRRPTTAVLPDAMHPGDRIMAERECEEFAHALWWVVAPDAFWVNPFHSRMRAVSKPLQLREAARAGLSIPSTLCSNEPERIRKFIRDNPGETIYKPFKPSQWQLDDGVAYLFTSTVTEDDLPEDEMLRLSPGIFQAKLEKSHELRVTFMGNRPFIARMQSQAVAAAQVDWRAAAWDIAVEPDELPEPVVRGCRALMAQLGIVFGCFDFIVTPAGEHVFLEVNQMGQFLWLESLNPELLLLDAFCEFLIQGSPDFHWKPTADSVRFRDLHDEEIDGLHTTLDQRHVSHIFPFQVEDRWGHPRQEAD